MRKLLIQKQLNSLKNRARKIRISAIEILAEAGDNAVVPELIEMLNDREPLVCAASARALGILRDNRAVPGLNAALYNKDKQVRKLAAIALGHIGDAGAIAALIEHLTDLDDGDFYFTIVTSISQNGSFAIPQLEEAAKSDNAQIRITAVSALNRIADPVAESIFFAGLRDDSYIVRFFSVQGLGAIKNTTAIPAMIRILTDDSELQVRYAASRVLEEFADRSAIDAMISVLIELNEPNANETTEDKLASRNIREIAVEYLGDLGDERALPALTTAALRDDDVAHEATCSLIKIGGYAAVPALRELAARGYEDAAFWLAERGDIVALHPLLNLTINSDFFWLDKIATALFLLGDSVSLPRRILSQLLWTPEYRSYLIDRLRGLREQQLASPIYYVSSSGRREKRVARKFEYPDTLTLCKQVMLEDDPDAAAGAHSVLEWLTVNRELLHATTKDDNSELLRSISIHSPEHLPRIPMQSTETSQAETNIGIQ